MVQKTKYGYYNSTHNYASNPCSSYKLFPVSNICFPFQFQFISKSGKNTDKKGEEMLTYIHQLTFTVSIYLWQLPNLWSCYNSICPRNVAVIAHHDRKVPLTDSCQHILQVRYRSRLFSTYLFKVRTALLCLTRRQTMWVIWIMLPG